VYVPEEAKLRLSPVLKDLYGEMKWKTGGGISGATGAIYGIGLEFLSKSDVGNSPVFLTLQRKPFAWKQSLNPSQQVKALATHLQQEDVGADISDRSLS